MWLTSLYLVFSGLAGHAAEFSRGQLLHGALILQPQDEEQTRAAPVITMATLHLHFGSSIPFALLLKTKMSILPASHFF